MPTVCRWMRWLHRGAFAREIALHCVVHTRLHVHAPPPDPTLPRLLRDALCAELIDRNSRCASPCAPMSGGAAARRVPTPLARGAGGGPVQWAGQRTGQGKGLPLGQGKGVPLGQGKGVPLGQGKGVPLGQGKGVPLGQGKGVPLGQGKGVPLGQGKGVPLGQGKGVPLGQGKGVPLGQGKGVPLGQGKGVPLGQGKGVPLGQGKGVPLGQGKGVPLGQGKGVPLGQGKGVPLGQGKGVPLGQGKGVPLGQGKGVPLGQGKGVPLGQGKGVPLGQGKGVPLGQGSPQTEPEAGAATPAQALAALMENLPEAGGIPLQHLHSCLLVQYPGGWADFFGHLGTLDQFVAANPAHVGASRAEGHVVVHRRARGTAGPGAAAPPAARAPPAAAPEREALEPFGERTALDPDVPQAGDVEEAPPAAMAPLGPEASTGVGGRRGRPALEGRVGPSLGMAVHAAPAASVRAPMPSHRFATARAAAAPTPQPPVTAVAAARATALQPPSPSSAALPRGLPTPAATRPSGEPRGEATPGEALNALHSVIPETETVSVSVVAERLMERYPGGWHSEFGHLGTLSAFIHCHHERLEAHRVGSSLVVGRQGSAVVPPVQLGDGELQVCPCSTLPACPIPTCGPHSAPASR